MLNNFLIGEQKTGGNENVVLRKDNENTMDIARKQWISLKENVIKKTLIFRIRKWQLKFWRHMKKKESLENLTLPRHIDGKNEGCKKRVTYPWSLYRQMDERGAQKIVNWRTWLRAIKARKLKTAMTAHVMNVHATQNSRSWGELWSPTFWRNMEHKIKKSTNTPWQFFSLNRNFS